MTPRDTEHLIDRLILVEGSRRHAYKDSKGLLTIGIGRLCDPSVPSSGLTLEEQRYLCANDIDRAEHELVTAFPWVEAINGARRCVLIELVFNMGIGTRLRGFRSFTTTIPLLARGEWAPAAVGFKRSKWYRDVGPRRADPLLAALISGELPPEW